MEAGPPADGGAAEPAKPEREPTCWINGQPVYDDDTIDDMGKMRG